MASVSEQLASRINFGSIAKAEDLKKENYFHFASFNRIQNWILHSNTWY